MLTSFWEKISEGFGEDWNVAILTPAFAFWAGGGVLLILTRHPNYPSDLARLDIVSTIVVLLVSLFVLIMSQYIVQSLAIPVLHLFEGYWGKLLGQFRLFVTHLVIAPILEKKERRWQILAEAFMQGRLNTIELEEYARLDADLSNYPVEESRNQTQRMPTVLGNMLRAGEQYSNIRYGLQMNVIMPRLWLVLPENAQKEITETRHALDRYSVVMIWSILFSVWCIWSWSAVIVSLILSFLAIRSIVSAAEKYVVLIRSAYDDYRFDLYKSLNWPLPLSSRDELLMGTELTSYLSRGPLKEIVFNHQ